MKVILIGMLMSLTAISAFADSEIICRTGANESHTRALEIVQREINTALRDRGAAKDLQVSHAITTYRSSTWHYITICAAVTSNGRFIYQAQD